MHDVMTVADHTTSRRHRRDGDDPKYRAPDADVVARVSIETLIEGARTIAPGQRHRIPGYEQGVFCVGERSLVKRRSIAIVGSRDVSAEGARRAQKLAAQLVGQGIVVVSGLAKGVDANAHTAAIKAGGETIAVIGTPVDRAYPAENARLQETIYREHLLISPFDYGHKTQRSSFPERNKLMAAISDGTCIIEATDESGSLHQAGECARLDRWLFILRSVVENPTVTWPRRFLGDPQAKVRIVDTVDDILRALVMPRDT
jgi:DNA processing protein